MQVAAAFAVAATPGALTAEDSAVQAAKAAVERIEAIDRKGPRLNSVIAIDPDWRPQARVLDAEAKAGKRRGPVHGRPLLIKDNIETAGAMATTAGSLALAENITGRDAPLVARLRGAGALILGKANLSEWANFRSSRSMSGWSAAGGLVRNPYVLDRTACGSSSGSAAAVAAGLAWAAVGTETDGSIVCPASINGLVGLKPTLGLISRTYVIPLSHSQDTPGPLTKTVEDAAALLTAMAGSDPADPATREADARKIDYTAAMTGSVRGVRIGVLRDRVGAQPQTRAVFERALIMLKNAGAELIDIEKSDAPKAIGDDEFTVLITEFKADLNAYLATTPPTVKTRTLADLIAFNTAHIGEEMPYFGQEIFLQAEATKGLDDANYRRALTASRNGARETLTKLFVRYNVAMLIAPTTGPAWLSDPVHGDQSDGPSASSLPAISGFPHLTVPMGQVKGLPLGLSFIGPAWSEGALLNAGDAFEKARGPLPGPAFAPTIGTASK